MKQKKTMQDLKATLKVALRFGRQHLATLTMIEGTYVRQPLRYDRGIGLGTKLTIKTYGNLYQLTRTDYVGDLPASENTWLASYAWHSCGQLMEIGGNRFCIFDAASGSMYLESLTEQADTKLELFVKIINSR